jgi:hypothetical protein
MRPRSLRHLRDDAIDVALAVAGDINSDGRDEAVFVVGQRPACIGVDALGREGRRLWTLDLPVTTSSPAIADATGNGRLSILLRRINKCRVFHSSPHTPCAENGTRSVPATFFATVIDSSVLMGADASLLGIE